MGSIIKKLYSKNLITPPDFVVNSIQYEVIMGSISYGTSNDMSDVDIYGFCIPPKEMIFPHLNGEIRGFGRQKKKFEQYQQHHIYDTSNRREYDIHVYNIVKYFQLLMDNNPNIIDSLFVPERCILYETRIGKIIRENRKMFLHKGAWHRFKGYAFSQLKKAKTKKPEGKRKELVEKHGYDTRFASHIFRLLCEVEQILIEKDLNLQLNREQIKSIKEGEWTLEQIEEWFYSKEKDLEQLYINSDLPYGPDESKIKKLLLNCLEEYYGSLDNIIHKEDQSFNILEDLKQIINRYSK